MSHSSLWFSTHKTQDDGQLTCLALPWQTQHPAFRVKYQQACPAVLYQVPETSKLYVIFLIQRFIETGEKLRKYKKFRFKQNVPIVNSPDFSITGTF